MGGLTIYKDSYADATAVSNIFIDEFMRDANDAQLKIYIYLIRMMSTNLSTSVSDIADKFNHTEKDVMRALQYWEGKHLLALDFDDAKNLKGIHLLDLSHPAAEKKTPPAPVVALIPKASTAASVSPESVSQESVSQESVSYEKPCYTMDQLRDFKSNEETSQLLFVAEQYVGRPLTPSEIKTVLFISDRLVFSADLIDYLIQYCVGRGKKDFRYIEKVALSWAQAGIAAPDQAERYAYKYDKTIYDIMKALGKTNAPTNKEVDFMNHWTKDFGFEMDVISAACEKTVSATEKHRFEYTDSILSSWYKAQVHHVQDIAKADEDYHKSRVPQVSAKPASSNKFNQFKQNNYDFDALEKELISN